MINRRRAPPLPTFQRLQASMREFDNLPFSMGSAGSNNSYNSSNPSNNNSNSSMNASAMNMHLYQQGSPVPVNMNPNGAAIVPPSTMSSSCSARNATGATSTSNNSDPAWRETGGDDLRRLRTRCVVNIERMLRNHQPHDVLTQVPENYDWRSKTFQLALKIEKLMFLAATSRENYLNEHTLRSRVQLLSRHLVRIRKRKNAMASTATSV